MPLSHLAPSMRRVTPATGVLFCPRDHPLHKALLPVLLTPRSSAQKYQTHIPKLLVDEDAVPDPEANILWYAYKFEKTDSDDSAKPEDRDQEAAEDRWRATWLGRLERREVMIQILLHYILLSLSAPTKPTDSLGDADLLASPKKRKRTPPELVVSYEVLEERLEGFMDKLAMWQLTDSLEKLDSEGSHLRQGQNDKGKGKQADDRDQLQIFCEDIVEPIFKMTLPSHCALLRSKVFPHSPFSDDSDLETPPSPKSKNKRMKTSVASSRRASPSARAAAPSRQLERSRSLSVTLEEERERSRSLSIGPANMRKRILTREVSMSTTFKPKPAKSKVQPTASEKKASATQEKDQSRNNGAAVKGVERDKGRTLVAATPAKPKNKLVTRSFGRGPSAYDGAKLPALAIGTPSSHSAAGESVEGDEDDDEWMIAGSPDVLLLTSSSGQDDWESGDDETSDQDRGQNQVLAAETPTRPARIR
ncbi:hypothetical protein EIP91_003333 [Steccherinum ochraceum]|uniref:DNA replication regulator Sld3 C-terminal domain-containing protein n=1 Tax=Steccherinum ochraceum TaxID=92696 RepID=A0A4R0RCA5_9APHY|nr:hypothetical protein EIP91_003333 [Steccherinum ochraceum]